MKNMLPRPEKKKMKNVLKCCPLKKILATPLRVGGYYANRSASSKHFSKRLLLLTLISATSIPSSKRSLTLILLVAWAQGQPAPA